jgi:hypothetical protein
MFALHRTSASIADSRAGGIGSLAPPAVWAACTPRIVALLEAIGKQSG